MAYFRWGKSPDFHQLLGAQLSYAALALQRLEAWCEEPSQELVDEIFRVESEADDARTALSKALATAFETPLDREDLNDLSRSVDDFIDQIRHVARAGAALKVKPVEPVRQMVVNLQQGIVEIAQALPNLPRRPEAVQKHVTLARRPLRLNERLYSSGVAELFENEDVRQIFRQMELFRSVIALSEFLEDITDILDHAINKLV